MVDSTLSHLIFRRQYLITSEAVDCPFSFKTEAINKDFQLYYHPDLAFSKKTEGDKKIILLGDLFDWQKTEYQNVDILNDLIKYDFDPFLEKISFYSGRFVLIYIDNEKVRLIHDATAQRKIFFSVNNGNTMCASNPHILSNIFNYKANKDVCWDRFYNSEQFTYIHNSNVGSYTMYKEVRQVLPNHYLCLDDASTIRYWPDKKIVISDSEIVSISSKMIKGFISAAAHRYKLMIPVTSGGDSRIILAATKDLNKNIYYYLNYPEGTNQKELSKKPDVWVPTKLLGKFNKDFHLVSYDNSKVDENFKQVYYHNNPKPYDIFLPIIYKYYTDFSDMINVPGGVIPIIKSLFYKNNSNISGKFLAELYNVQEFPCAVKFYEEWLEKSLQSCNNSGISVFDLIYWEDRTCNWGGQIVQDKDIAQEEFVPFNSRYLLHIMLSYTRELRMKPKFELHKKIIEDLWPELLEIDFNPSFKSYFKKHLISIGLYPFAKKIIKSVKSLRKH